MKGRGRLIGGMTGVLCALALGGMLLPGCGSNPDAPEDDSLSTVTVSLDVPAKTGAEVEAAVLSFAGAFPTRLPDHSDWTTTLTFEHLSGLYTHGPENIQMESPLEVNLDPGVWFIVGHAQKGGTDVGRGSETVVAAEDESLEVAIILGPITGAGLVGSLQVKVNLPSGAVAGSLAIETFAGDPVATLPLEVGANERLLDVASGTYLLVTEVTGADGRKDGVVEAVHIYPSLNTEFAWSPTRISSTPMSGDDYNLTSKVPAPVAGAAIPATLTGEHYSGIIIWKTLDDQVAAGTTFAADTAYKAEIILNAAEGYTFAGTASDAFYHAGAESIANLANTGIVSIVFPVTGGGADDGPSYDVPITIGFNEKIVITGWDGESNNVIYKSGTPGSLTLSASTFYANVRWFVEAAQVTRNLSSNNRVVVIEAADYDVGEHTITFVGTVGDKLYSQRIPLTVMAAGSGNGNTDTNGRYTVTFDAAGGYPVPTAQSVVARGYAVEPAIPTKAGYAFYGWWWADAPIPSGFSGAWTGDYWYFETYAVQKNITLTAKWGSLDDTTIDLSNPPAVTLSGTYWDFTASVLDGSQTAQQVGYYYTVHGGSNVTVIGSAQGLRIKVAGGTGTVMTLNNAKIVHGTYSPIELASGADVTLLLLGTSTFSCVGTVAAFGPAGIAVPVGTTLVIDSASSTNRGTAASSHSEAGTLSVTGYQYGAGIGGSNTLANGSGDGPQLAGTITILGGTITATGGDGAAGIGGGGKSTVGGGGHGDGGTITIAGGRVTASGGSTGIGAGQDGGSGNITITGGTVIATGDSGAGIGNSNLGINPGYAIVITGGTITARCNGYTAAIGGGVENWGAANFGAISINYPGGDSTGTAIGGKNAKAIGPSPDYHGPNGETTLPAARTVTW